MKTADQKNQLKEIKTNLQQFLSKGFSKAELARSLKISRSTLLNILDDASYIPSATILRRLESNVDWLEKTKGHETLDVLLFLHFQHQNVLQYFQSAIDKAERITGLKVGYHGVTLGGPVGFVIFHTPGIETWSELLAHSPFIRPAFGRTESYLLGGRSRIKGKHEDARLFYEKHPKARVYLKLFQNYGFTTYRDLQQVQALFKKPKYSESIFCLESGVIAGKYDYFILIIAKDEQAYTQFLNDDGGVYHALQGALTDSKTLTIAPQHALGLFKPGNFNLSFNEAQINQQIAYAARNQVANQ